MEGRSLSVSPSGEEESRCGRRSAALLFSAVELGTIPADEVYIAALAHPAFCG
jgi:hypothetical protein